MHYRKRGNRMCKKVSTRTVLELLAIVLIVVVFGVFVLKMLLMCADSINNNTITYHTQRVG